MEKWIPWFVLGLSILLIVGFIMLSGCTSEAQQSSIDSSSGQTDESGNGGDAGTRPPLDGGSPPDGFPGGPGGP